jgi:5-methylcytosine-specific restriction endonuclease McrA
MAGCSDSQGITECGLNTHRIYRARLLRDSGWCIGDIAVALDCSRREVLETLLPKPARRRSGRPGSVPLAWREVIYSRCNGKCAYCDETDRRILQFDHIVPLSRGGRHAIDNIQLACRLCNQSKGPRTEPQRRGKEEQWSDRVGNRVPNS